VADYHEVGEQLWERFSGGREGTLWYYRAVLEKLRTAPPGPSGQRLVGELEGAVQALEALGT